MNLHEYLSQERGRQAALAKAIGAHAPDISRWADGSRAIPFHFGAPIEVATGGAVSRQEMFPDDWARLWPELAQPATRRKNDPAPTAVTDPDPPLSRKNLLEFSASQPPLYVRK
ncbi:MAG: helix-turn-helix domain-containing protein [Burkholderiaceae bacterium]|nr:helix-turn-helix domain-containing protein [Burkholderiaceae bacterium]